MKPPALLLSVLALGLGARAVASAPTAADLEFFERKVRPVLSEHCASCHAKGKARGRLDLGSRAGLLKGGESGPAVVPGDPDKSLLIQALRYHKPDLRMPPKGKLPDAVVAD